jgi:hypothetical protein
MLPETEMRLMLYVAPAVFELFMKYEYAAVSNR